MFKPTKNLRLTIPTIVVVIIVIGISFTLFQKDIINTSIVKAQTPNQDQSGTGQALGLVAHYTFDEGSGATTVDASGNNNTATLQGPTWVAGQSGQALSFDGVDDYVDCTASSSLAVGGSLSNASWAFWINPEHDGREGGSDTILYKGRWYSGRQFYDIFHRSDYWGLAQEGVINIRVSDNWSKQIVSSNGIIQNDQWSHVVVVYDGTNISFYINGVLDSTKPLSVSVFPTTTGDNCVIGTRDNQDAYFEPLDAYLNSHQDPRL